MKKLLLGLLLVAPALSQAQDPTKFTLKGTIGKLNAPAKVYLMQNNRIDSAALKNGAFELTGTTDVPKTARLVLQREGKLKAVFRGGPSERIEVFLEPGPVVISTPDSLQKAKVTGGKLTTEYNKLRAAMKSTEAGYEALGAEYRKATPEQRQAPEFKQRMEARDEALTKERNERYGAYIKANPKSWVSFDALQQMGGFMPQYAQVAPYYEMLSPELKNSPVGRKYAEKLQALKAVAIGAQAPNFAQQTPDGKTVSLADYRGKYVLVDFWASWCKPCREENPAVAKVYNEYKTRNFDVLGVSLDDAKGREKWLKAIQDDQLAWTQVSDLKGWQNEAARLYYVQGIPQNFLVDPNGKIVAANLRGDALKTTLARFIK